MVGWAGLFSWPWAAGPDLRKEALKGLKDRAVARKLLTDALDEPERLNGIIREMIAELARDPERNLIAIKELIKRATLNRPIQYKQKTSIGSSTMDYLKDLEKRFTEITNTLREELSSFRTNRPTPKLVRKYKLFNIWTRL